MSSDDWHTLRVPPEAYDAAKAQKEDHGRTWGEQIVRPTDEDDDDVDAIVDALVAEIDTAAFDGGLSDDTAQRIIGRIDDLETELTTQHERLGR